MDIETEKDLCQITFEAWWTKEYYPFVSPTYDDSIDSSNEAWYGFKAAWEIRGKLNSNLNRG